MEKHRKNVEQIEANLAANKNKVKDNNSMLLMLKKGFDDKKSLAPTNDNDIINILTSIIDNISYDIDGLSEKELNKVFYDKLLQEIKQNHDTNDSILTVVKEIFDEATMVAPENIFMQSGGKEGKHTEHLGFILTELQYMQRAYPNSEW